MKSEPRRLWSRLLIWAALAVVTTAAVSTAHADTAGARMPAAAAAHADAYLASALSATAAPAASAPAALSAPSVLAATATRPAAAASDEQPADANMLPAWRMRNSEFDADAGGLLGELKKVPVTIAEMLFGLANFLWLLLLTVMNFGLSGESLIRLGADALNGGFAFIGQKLVYFGIPILAYALWAVVKGVLRGDRVKTARKAAVFLVGMGMLAGMANRAEFAAANGDNSITVAGSPSWVANEMLELGGIIAEPLSAPVLRFTSDREPVGEGEVDIAKQLEETIDCNDPDSGVTCPTEEAVEPQTLNCTDYINEIEEQYLAQPGSDRTLVMLSRMWQNTYFKSYSLAQFGVPGPSDLPDRAICHWAEEQSKTSIDDRWATMQAVNSTAFSGSTPYFVLGPFRGNTKDMRKAMTAFAACNYDGGWTVYEPYATAYESSKLADACANAFAAVSEDADPAEDDDSDGFGDFEIYGSKIDDALGSAAQDRENELREAREFAEAFSGGNPSERVMQGLLTLLVACMFLYTLGLIGIGLFVASLLAIASLCVGLPLALVLLAVDSPKAGPLFRVVVTSLMSKTMFVLLLSAIVLLSGVFQALMSSAVQLPLMIRGIGYGIAPLIAFWILRKLLGSIGMADLLAPSGALTFGAAAALKASGDKNLVKAASTDRNGKNALQNGLSKTPGLGNKLDKLDRYAPTRDNWSADGRKSRRDLNDKEAAEAAERRELRDIKRRRLQNRINNYRTNLANRGIIGTLRDAKDSAVGRVKGGVANAEIWDRLGTLGSLARAAGTTATGGAILRRTGAPDPATAATDIDVDDPDLLVGERAAEGRTRIVKNLGDMLNRLTTDALSDLENLPPGTDQATVQRLAREMVGARLVNMLASARLPDADLAIGDTLSHEQVDGIQLKYAAKHGYDPRDVIVTHDGIVVPRADNLGAKNPDLTPQQLQNYVHWLPAEDRARRPNEADHEYAARIHAMGMARGYVHPDGRTAIDVLSTVNLDIKDPNVAARIKAWQEGNVDALLDSLVVRASNSSQEQRLIQIVQETARNTHQKVQHRTDEQLRAQTIAAQDSARSLPQDASTVNQQVVTAAAAAAAVVVASQSTAAARTSGDHEALTKASARFEEAIEKLDAAAGQLSEGIEHVYVRVADIAGTAGIVAREGMSQVEARVDETLKQLLEMDQQLRDAIDGIHSNTLSPAQAQELFERIGHQLSNDVQDALAKFTAALSAENESRQRLSGASPHTAGVPRRPDFAPREVGNRDVFPD